MATETNIKTAIEKANDSIIDPFAMVCTIEGGVCTVHYVTDGWKEYCTLQHMQIDYSKQISKQTQLHITRYYHLFTKCIEANAMSIFDNCMYLSFTLENATPFTVQQKVYSIDAESKVLLCVNNILPNIALMHTTAYVVSKSNTNAQSIFYTLNSKALNISFGKRQMEIIQLIAQGKSEKEIGEILLSPVNTVESNINTIHNKIKTLSNKQMYPLNKVEILNELYAWGVFPFYGDRFQKKENR